MDRAGCRPVQFAADSVLADRLVDSTRVAIERRLTPRDLYVLPRAVVAGSLSPAPFRSPQEFADIRELGKQLRADLTLLLTVDATTGGVLVSPVVIRGRNTAATLPPIAASTLGHAAAQLAEMIVNDSTLRRR